MAELIAWNWRMHFAHRGIWYCILQAMKCPHGLEIDSSLLNGFAVFL